MATHTSIGELIFRITADTKALRKGMSETQRSISGLKKSFMGIAAAAGLAFSAQAVIKFTKEIVNLAGEMEGVKDAFDRIAAPGLLKDLREATRNTVTDLDLMKRSVMAHNFQIPLEQLASLFAFATKRAQQTGESVDYLVNSIVIGIGRKSPLILDNLGISAVKLREELEHAGHSGSTVFQVAQAVGRIAQEEMSKAGEIITTTKVATEQLAAAWGNVKARLGEVVIEQTDLSTSLNKLAKSISEIDPDDNNLLNAVKKWKDQFILFNPVLLSSLVAIGEINKHKEGIGNWIKGLGPFLKTLPFLRMISSIDMGGGGVLAPDQPIPTTVPPPPPPAPKMTLEEFKKISAEYQRQTALINYQTEAINKEIRAFTESFSVKELLGSQTERFIGLLEEEENILDGSEKVIEKYVKSLERVKEATETMTMGLQSAFASMATGIGEAFGNLVTGTGNFFQELGLLIANLAKMIGSLMIAIGTAFLGSGIFAGFGVPMLAAGVGLVAAGQVASNLINRSGGAAPSGVSAGNFTAQGITVTGKLSGRDIYLSSQRGQMSLNNTT